MFWEEIKTVFMNFVSEFHASGKLSNHIGSSFITLIAKKPGAESNGFPLSSFQVFWEEIKTDFMNFVNEFHDEQAI